MASDVTILSSTRRDVAVEFQVQTTSETIAATGANTLNVAITDNAATFKTDLNAAGGNLASVTSSSTTSAPAVHAVSSAAAVVPSMMAVFTAVLIVFVL